MTLKSFVATAALSATWILSPAIHYQTEKPKSPAPTVPAVDGWGRNINPLVKEQQAVPAPTHDLTGIWDPLEITGVQPLGAGAVPVGPGQDLFNAQRLQGKRHGPVLAAGIYQNAHID